MFQFKIANNKTSSVSTSIIVFLPYLLFQLRKESFIQYLRMNLASLVGSEYDSVLFNSVSFTPNLLVNVSLDWNGREKRIVKTLSALAKHNDTLLDLSGSHFNVTRWVDWVSVRVEYGSEIWR